MKGQENKNKKILRSDDILYMNDFILEKFSNFSDSIDVKIEFRH